MGGTESFAVLNPATGDVPARAPECTREELDRAMGAGNEAQAAWQPDAAARRAGLARLITQEQGKPLRESRSEVADAIGDLRYFAGLKWSGIGVEGGTRGLEAFTDVQVVHVRDGA